MKRTTHQHSSLPILMPLLLLCVLLPDRAMAASPLDHTITLDIRSGTSLETALVQWGYKSGMQVMMAAGSVANLDAPAIESRLTARDALTSLLRGSGLSYTVEKNTVRIVLAPHKTAVRAPPKSGSLRHSATSWTRPRNQRNERPPAADASYPPQHSAASGPGDPPSTEAQATGANVALQEVIVTAEKTTENSLDVPMSLTAVTGTALLRNHAFRFQDYVGTIPGLTLVNYGAFGSQLVIRGMTSGSVPINSSVATYIDETPYGVEGPFAGSGFAAPNLDTFDMRRIEVLRGPQGTLYGSNALAGLVKYVTNPPDPAAFRAESEFGMSSVSHGGTGYDAHGMVNVPLSRDSALRIVGYENFYPGFIDDPGLHANRTDSSHFWGGRASFLFEPSDSLSVRLSALYQDRSYGDLSNEDVQPVTLTPIYGQWTQNNLIRQPGQTATQVYNATIKVRGSAYHLLSSTSYMRFNPHSIWDWSKEFGPIFTTILGQPFGAALVNIRPASAWTQELRLTSASNSAFQWLVGGFFTDENSKLFEGLYPVDTVSGAVLYDYTPQLTTFDIPTHYREFAGFANIDYYIIRNLDVQVGGRYSHNSQRFHETATGLLEGAGQNFDTTSSEGVATYSAALRWHLAPQRIVYARIAKGFVPGGPNDIVPTGTSLPRTYSSSTTTNYEMGLKASFLEGRFISELSAFLVKWNKIQVLATFGVFNSITNGGAAQSSGAEWTFKYLAMRGLTLDLNGSYTHAYLTDATPASVGGMPGDRLPFVPLVEGSLGATYQHPISSEYSLFEGADWQLSTNRYADFSSNGPRQQMPGYGTVDVRTGIQGPRWSLEVYANNLTNKVVINDLQAETLAGGFGPQSAVLNTPRTIGLSVTAQFP